MKRIQNMRTASQRADEGRRGRATLIILILCLVLAGGTIISTSLLGGSISRYSREERNVIALVPEKQQLRAAGEKDPAPDDGEEPESREAESQEPESRETESGTAELWSPGTTWNTTIYRRAAEENNTRSAQASTYQGELRITDDTPRSWSAETQVDLFNESYKGSGRESDKDTVKAEDGKKVIAPGTSNLYTFTLENNGNLPLDYTISLKVESFNEGPENAPEAPLEWRLLDGNSTPLGDWRGYGETAEVMKQTRLDDRKRDSYTIEWRWAYERDAEGDRTDTELGDLAAKQLLNTKATIIVHAEQDTEQIPDASPTPTGRPHRPYRPYLWPKTGDNSNLMLYTVLLAVSGGGLLILFMRVRRRKKRE